MPKGVRYRHVSIIPAMGGALVASASDDVAGSANYVGKVNFRREVDGELRREGWELVKETGRDDALDSEFPIRLLHQFPSARGEGVLIAAAGPTIYRLMSAVPGYATPNDYVDNTGTNDYWSDHDEDFWWVPIYTSLKHMDTLEADGTLLDPFEGGAYRWEAVSVQNHVIINNGVDLPIIYKADWDQAYPLYSLREQGIASVGTISTYQDRLWCADLQVITDGFQNLFDLGTPAAITGATTATPIAITSAGHNLSTGDTVKITGVGGISAANGSFLITKIDANTFSLDNTIGVGTYTSGGSWLRDPYGNLFSSSLHIDNGGTLKTQRYQYRMLYSMEGYPSIFDTSESGGLSANLVVEANGTYKIVPEWDFAVQGDGLADPATPYVLSAAYLDVEGISLHSDSFGEKTIDDKYYLTNGGVVSRIFLAAGAAADEYKLVNSAGADIALKYINVSSGVCTDPTGATTSQATQELCELAGNTWTAATGSYLAAGTYPILIRPYINKLLPQLTAAFREFADDGSMIHKMKTLADKLVVYRDTGFFFINKTNSTTEPFAIDPRYVGGRVPDFRHTVIDVDGRQHLFVGHSGVYSINRSSSEPETVMQFELGPPFWRDVAPEFSEYVYAVDNPVTREMFISAPLGYLTNSIGEYVDEKGEVTTSPRLEWGAIAYDYINKTLSTIDASFTACCWARRPRFKRVGPEQAWFIMGVHQSENNVYVGTQYRHDTMYGGVLVRYGYGPPEIGSIEPYRVYNRLAEGYTSTLRSGLIDFGDSFSDKEVRGYVLELSNKYGVTPIKVTISTSSAVQGTEQIETMTETSGREVKYVILNELKDENMIPLYVRAPYIRDQIDVPPEYDITSAYVQPNYYRMMVNSNGDGLTGYGWDYITIKNNPVKVVGRTFDVSGVDTRQAQQAIGGQGQWPA
jgi:hypothetical protein